MRSRVKKINVSALAINVAIPFLVGMISGFIISPYAKPVYQSIAKPPCSPSYLVFPIVWGIIYLLTGLAAYLAFSSAGNKNFTIAVYALNLLLNFIWPIVFFACQAFVSAAIILVLLDFVLVLNIILFYKLNVASGLLLLPYHLWLCYAAYLNFGIIALL